MAKKPHPCRGARADRKGRELARPPRKLTPQRNPGAPRKQRKIGAAASTAKAERPGRGGAETTHARQMAAPPSRQPSRYTRAAPPRKLRVFRAALCHGGGRGSGERRLRALLGPRFPIGGWVRWSVEAALTAAAAAAASAAAAAAWRRPIHPPAAGRLAAWEGPGAWAARLLRIVARASSSSTNPLPSPPPPPSSSTSSGQPTARPLLEPGSAVAMAPGKHS